MTRTYEKLLAVRSTAFKIASAAQGLFIGGALSVAALPICGWLNVPYSVTIGILTATTIGIGYAVYQVSLNAYRRDISDMSNRITRWAKAPVKAIYQVHDYDGNIIALHLVASDPSKEGKIKVDGDDVTLNNTDIVRLPIDYAKVVFDDEHAAAQICSKL